MRRLSSIAAIFALALSTLAMAQGNQHRPAGRPAARPAPHAAPVVRAPVVRRPVVHGPVVHGPVVHGPVVHGPAVRGPVVHGRVGPVRVGTPYLFRGRPYAWHSVRFPHPWVYPPGYAYRLWVVGAILPPLFWSSPTYYYTDWDAMGLPPPDPGFQYVQYGPDLLLVNIATGEVVQVFPGAFN
jgi:Ni/Co efflux regulator RcnB